MILSLIKAATNYIQQQADVLEVKNMNLETLTERMNESTLTIGQWEFVNKAMKDMQELQSSIKFQEWMDDHSE
jgi:hypothetical protein